MMILCPNYYPAGLVREWGQSPYACRASDSFYSLRRAYANIADRTIKNNIVTLGQEGSDYLLTVVELKDEIREPTTQRNPSRKGRRALPEES